MNLDSPSDSKTCAGCLPVRKLVRGVPDPGPFELMKARFPDTQFLWIDVEGVTNLLHPLDVEDFLRSCWQSATKFTFGTITRNQKCWSG